MRLEHLGVFDFGQLVFVAQTRLFEHFGFEQELDKIRRAAPLHRQLARLIADYIHVQMPCAPTRIRQTVKLPATLT